MRVVCHSCRFSQVSCYALISQMGHCLIAQGRYNIRPAYPLLFPGCCDVEPVPVTLVCEIGRVPNDSRQRALSCTHPRDVRTLKEPPARSSVNAQSVRPVRSTAGVPEGRLGFSRESLGVPPLGARMGVTYALSTYADWFGLTCRATREQRRVRSGEPRVPQHCQGKPSVIKYRLR
jgi:hypothetical protein